MLAANSVTKPDTGIVYKTKQSLVLGFSAIIGLMLCLVIFRYYELDTNKFQIEQITQNHLAKLDLVATMRSAAHERTLALQRMLLQSDPFVRDEEWIRFNQLGADFARARLKILSLPLSEEEKTLLDYQGNETKKALDAQRRVLELLDKDHLEQAREVLLKSVIPTKEQVINQLNTFYHYQQKQAETIANNASELYNRLTTLLLIVSLFTCGFGIIIAIYVTRKASNTETALTAAYNSIQKLSEEKSQFLADVINECRSPLESLITHSNSIAVHCKDNRQHNKDFLSDIAEIQHACSHLSGLRNEIMDITKVESDKTNLASLELDINELINDVSTQIKPIAAKNNNQIRVQCVPNLGFLQTDPNKLRQILFNLLANACKYTESGLITLSVKVDTMLDAEHHPQRWLHFNVIDTGIGIAADKYEKIFSTNTRYRESRSSIIEDSGLSLSISRRLARLLGGEITVNSQPGMGSVFSIKLPYTNDYSPNPAALSRLN